MQTHVDNTNSLENSELLKELIKEQKKTQRILSKLIGVTELNTEYTLRGKEVQFSAKRVLTSKLAELEYELTDFQIDQVNQMTLFRLFELDKQVTRKARELLGPHITQSDISKLVSLIIGRQNKKVSKLLSRNSITWWDKANATTQTEEALYAHRKSCIQSSKELNRVVRDLSKSGLKISLIETLVKAGSLPVSIQVIFEDSPDN
jgi:hypothetical protein